MTLTRKLNAVLDAHVARSPEDLTEGSKTCACAHIIASREGHIQADVWRGHAQLFPQPVEVTQTAPRFDLASLTKVIVPATLAMQAIDEGRCALNTPLHTLIPGWCAPESGRDATLGELLNHTSGLPGWYKYYEDYAFPPDREDLPTLRTTILTRVMETPREAPGSRYAYSDLGYMALMVLLEELFEERLDVLAHQRIFKPLGMSQTRYVNLSHGEEPLHHAVATEVTPERGAVRGIVHDENTHLLGGVSGHAGVFGTAGDLVRFGHHLLGVDAGHISASDAIVSRHTLKACWHPDSGSALGHHRAGWDTPSGQRSSAGRGFSAGDTVGHLGFTGTSIWLERTSQTCAVLLTNRVHPTRERPGILEMRIATHEAILPHE